MRTKGPIPHSIIVKYPVVTGDGRSGRDCWLRLPAHIYRAGLLLVHGKSHSLLAPMPGQE